MFEPPLGAHGVPIDTSDYEEPNGYLHTAAFKRFKASLTRCSLGHAKGYPLAILKCTRVSSHTFAFKVPKGILKRLVFQRG